MHLKSIQLSGFKSFARKSELSFTSPIAGIVGPNGSGKSNAAEAFRFVLGEQSMKALRGKRGTDMIWTGNDTLARANRARVSVVFDNTQQLFDIDFDEVVIERIVHRDGANEYSINGSKVRLKDITALLSSANIGSSGHHIISQGEADRILGASENERREMIEDALGLKTYQYKKTESEKKLEKTAENMKEVKILRREIAPHLTFLERQMKKLERAQELKNQIRASLTVYISHERAYIASESLRLQGVRSKPIQELENLHQELIRVEKPQTQQSENVALHALDERIRNIAMEKGKLEHARGRLEGQITLVQSGTVGSQDAIEKTAHIPFTKVEEFLNDVSDKIRKTENIHSLIERISDFLNEFRNANASEPSSQEEDSSELKDSLTGELIETKEALAALKSEEAALLISRTNALSAISQEQNKVRELQKHYFEIKEQKRDIERTLEDIEREDGVLQQTKERLKNIEWKAQDSGLEIQKVVIDNVRTRFEQDEILSEIQRSEARLEEAGFVDEDTVREYEETQKRDIFLKREVEDLEQSTKTLLAVIGALDSELSERFNEGLIKINSEFQNFFAMLFDGGNATLNLVKKTRKNEEGEEEEDEEAKEGIEIKVKLPRKKVTALDVLSGGERALTSIALIFAMSQVNPPPFIILDETDAALDEANSRKYADMVKTLAQKSQLILITHNRQTMEAAGELYGVTMGNDGISKLLSVKFDEAVGVAK
ncbi:MAG: hypothetical protein JKX80_01350 [Candidatus Pacebacteria bacterium]|nr:hypothetical protein [Candidatus Paceibacterota bacterium]